jgi:hypothetical protein
VPVLEPPFEVSVRDVPTTPRELVSMSGAGVRSEGVGVSDVKVTLVGEEMALR